MFEGKDLQMGFQGEDISGFRAYLRSYHEPNLCLYLGIKGFE